MITCYPSDGKRKALKLACDFAQGAAFGTVAPVGETKLRAGAAFVYGWTEHTVDLIRQCKRRGNDWYYCDNAYYFGRGEYFRVTRNALMHNGRGDASAERLEAHRLQLRSRKPHGSYVLIATQSKLFYEQRLGVSRETWTQNLIDRIRAYTHRPVMVLDKPEPGEMTREQPHASGFEAFLDDAACLVTESSSAAVKAVMDGVPVICVGQQHMCGPVQCGSLEALAQRDLWFPNDTQRWQWLRVLAANQWSREEMRSGQCWADLQAQRARELGAIA